jgi:predicted Zn-dependent protease
MPMTLPLDTSASRRQVPRVAAAVLAVLAIGCSKVPVTGRRQFNLIPDDLMVPLGKSAYQDTLSTAKVEKSGDDAELLKKVGGRIAKVTGEDYEWRYSLIDDDDTVNAWCLPGGKIAFYTGILPVLESEAGMAFVMGHEVGHAVAHHGAERLSQQLTALGGLAGLYLYLDKKTELTTTQKGLLLAAVGVGAEVGVLLPFSRKQEEEADLIGMMYMARAGYPPRQAGEVWDRMEAETGGSSMPVFLSTHPSNEGRKENLQEWLPKARRKYEDKKLGYDTTTPRWGKRAGSGGSGGTRTLSGG